MMEKFEGQLRTKPPFRNDQHPSLAETVPMQSYVSFSVSRVALIMPELEPFTLTHAVTYCHPPTSYLTILNRLK